MGRTLWQAQALSGKVGPPLRSEGSPSSPAYSTMPDRPTRVTRCRLVQDYPARISRSAPHRAGQDARRSTVRALDVQGVEHELRPPTDEGCVAAQVFADQHSLT